MWLCGGGGGVVGVKHQENLSMQEVLISGLTANCMVYNKQVYMAETRMFSIMSCYSPYYSNNGMVS